MSSEKDDNVQRKLLTTTGLAIVLFILVLANIIFSYANVRWDITEDKVYSLSSGSKKILKNLSEPVTVKLFYSSSNRGLTADFKLYAKRVREFLSEYEHAGGGLLEIEDYDPKIDSVEEEWAQKYGLRGVQTATGDSIYFGLVFHAGDQEEIIPWVDPTREELLEYDITRYIQRVQATDKKTVAVISSLPVFGDGPTDFLMDRQREKEPPWLFVSELKKTYDLLSISPSENRIRALDPDIDLLVLIHAKNISPQLQYAIDQYVLSGRNAMVYVDPLCITDPSQQQQQQQFMAALPSSNLEKPFSSWGISLVASKVVADYDYPTQVRTRQGGAEDNPLVITTREMAFDKENVVTSQLDSMLFALAGAIENSEDSKLEFTPLVKSGLNSELVDSQKVRLGAQVIKKDFVAGKKHLNLAVQVRGQFKTSFPDGPPEVAETEGAAPEQPKQEQLMEGTKKATIIIVGDADMMADHFYVQRSQIMGMDISKMFNDNLNFFLNACEILTGSDELVDLRTRGKIDRPFTAVMELQRTAQQRWLLKEQELEGRIEATNQKLRELEQQKDASQKMIMSPEQEKEVMKFREQKQSINRELKEVRKNLRADIEALESRLSWLNILLMPALVAFVGIAIAIYKQRRVKRK